MRKYLATIHEKPEHHKKRFALMVSGGFTLIIFAIWSLVNIGPSDRVVANDQNEISPFESLKASIGAAIQVLRSDVGDLKQGLETVNKYGRFQ